MKSITVKTENGVKCYLSPVCQTFSAETGEATKIELTEDEELQHCYQGLIDDVKQKEFEKHLVFLVKDYFGDIDDWMNIKVELSFSNQRQAFLNVSRHL